MNSKCAVQNLLREIAWVARRSDVGHLVTFGGMFLVAASICKEQRVNNHNGLKNKLCYTYTCISTFKFTHTHARVRVRTHARTHVRTHTHTHTHTYAHTHTLHTHILQAISLTWVPAESVVIYGIAVCNHSLRLPQPHCTIPAQVLVVERTVGRYV